MHLLFPWGCTVVISQSTVEYSKMRMSKKAGSMLQLCLVENKKKLTEICAFNPPLGVILERLQVKSLYKPVV